MTLEREKSVNELNVNSKLMLCQRKAAGGDVASVSELIEVYS